jgi:methionyl-tRNA formyltransferase
MDMKTFRIIFMGTPDFSVPTLEALLQGPDEVAAVVTQPDRRSGRGKKTTPPPVKVIAEKENIPVLQPTKIKTEEFRALLAAYKPDLMVVVAYGRILPPQLLELAHLGCINVHGSLLPRHRGAAPIQWAIIEGDEEVGVTVMQMDDGMDTGDILLPAKAQLEKDETAGSLFEKLSKLGAATLIEALDLLRQDKLTATSQDHSKATKAPPLKKEDGLLDWKKPARELQCRIRGLDPWPSSYSFLDGKRFRFFRPEIIYKQSNEPPGTLLAADNLGLVIATGENSLLIKEIQPDGKKRMEVSAFLCGHPLQSGMRFSSE